MKKYFSIFIAIIILLSFSDVKAVTYEEALDAIDEATISTNDFLYKLNNWAAGNNDAIIYLTTEEIIEKIDPSNYENTLNFLVNKLDEGYLFSSSSNLSVIKKELVNDLNNIKKNHQLIYAYLKENEEYGVSGNLDIMHELKKYSNNIDDKTGIIMGSLNNIYFNDLSKTINSYEFTDAINYVDNALLMSIKLLDVYTTDVSNWQDLYNSYITDGYEDKITSSSLYNKYLNKLNNAYDKFYNLIYSNFKNKLDSNVNEIDSVETDAVVHNNRIFGIIENLNTSKISLQNDFNTLNKEIKINLIKNNIKEKQNNILNKLEKEIEEVRTHLLDTIIIDVKNEKDEKYFNIDRDKELIKFSGGILTSSNFESKLETDYSNFKFDNLYDGNVGTGTKISVHSMFSLYVDDIKISEYIIVVAGDVEADGKISALDYIAIRNEIMGSKKISNDLSRLAGDCNNDNKITALDYIYIRNYIMNGGI